MSFRPAIIFMLIACTNGDQYDNEDTAKTTSIKKATEQTSVTIDSNVMKVFLDKAGQITVNGNPTSPDLLDSSFSKLKISNGWSTTHKTMLKQRHLGS